jgi:hypothetical protein
MAEDCYRLIWLFPGALMDLALVRRKMSAECMVISKCWRCLKSPVIWKGRDIFEWLGLIPGEKWDAKFCSIREVNKRLVLLEK